MRKSLKVLLTVAGVFVGTFSYATIIPWTANLDQAQETFVFTPAPGATGTAFGTIDTASGILDWNISWSGLSAQALAMHFHGAALPGSNAAVQVNIGAISGLASPSIGSASLSQQHITDLLAGLWYINIHTIANPGGEIRGQVTISAVPEPGTLGLLGAGLLVLGFVTRRKV